MGSCTSSQSEVRYFIALKQPHTLRFQHIKKSKWIVGENIHSWLESLYKCQNTQGYIVYNDQVENLGYTPKEHCGQCKGIITWDKKYINWLVHSVPEFPSSFDGTHISKIDYNEIIYGQSFILIKNIPISMFPNVIVQLASMNPNIYISKNYNNIDQVHKSFTSKVQITPEIMHIAKSPNYDCDIYKDILVNDFQSRYCICQSGIMSKDRIKDRLIKDVAGLTWVDETVYTSYSDNSKWAISSDSKVKWVFIGDLGRTPSQMTMGGGGFVIFSNELWCLFNTMTIHHS